MKRNRRGQAAVETALVMPLFVFLLLAVLQLALVHQARLMAKYAAYKAARAGSINSAGSLEMFNATLAVLVPVTVGGAPNRDHFFRADTPEHWGTAWPEVSKNSPYDVKTVPFATVRICNPTRPMIEDAVARARHLGSNINLAADGLDFDDPRIIGTSWKEASVTRLNVQVTLYYRMPIPFANALLWTMARGVENDTSVRVLRMTPGKVREGKDPNLALYNNKPRTIQSVNVQVLADKHIYILPIRASYGMRMQSKLWPTIEGYDLFEQRNFCKVPWKKDAT